MLSQDADGTLRRLVEREWPEMVARQRHAYAPEGLEAQRTLPRDEVRWGLIPGARYVAITREVERRDYAPRLARMGFEFGA